MIRLSRQKKIPLRASLSGLGMGLVLSLSLTFSALAAPMVPGQSVGSIALGSHDKVLNNQSFGLKLSKKGKDTEYEGQTVYYYYFGTKDKNNAYPIQVYSDIKHKIFIFEINSPKYSTPKGIHVGSSEKELNAAYGKSLKKQKRGRIYTKYSLGGRKGTDFYVKKGVVTQILIRNY